MKTIIIILFVFLSSCKSSFFAYERPMPMYSPEQEILIVKLSKSTPDYFIYKMRAIEERIPFYFKTEYSFVVGETIPYSKIMRVSQQFWYF